MTTRPSADVRRQVIRRAENLCEYCLLHQDFAASAHQVDHVISEKHGGHTVPENLALSCTACNRRKGSDIGSIDPETGSLTPLFNPRTEQWSDHLRFDGIRIVGLSPEGRTTVEFLKLNSFERLVEREELMRSGRFPPQKQL